MKLLVTGGAGFIGSAFVRYILSESTATSVVTLDKLTYAGNLENLASVLEDRRHRFVHGDICDRATVASILQEGDIDAIVHFAAESHVDRSILSPDDFVETNIRGTATLLDAARQAKTERFVLVSTDEVYGDIEAPLEADETFPVEAEQPICGVEGRRRPAGAVLLPDLSFTGADHAGIEQLRAVSVSRKTDPADDLKRHRGRCRCRCTATACRFATGCTSTTIAEAFTLCFNAAGKERSTTSAEIVRFPIVKSSPGFFRLSAHPKRSCKP